MAAAAETLRWKSEVSPRARWVLFLSWAVLQLWLIFSHSPWFDEEHALLISRAPWSELLKNLKYEGHPALWYLWLGSFDRAIGGSAWALPLAQVPIALGLSGLIWFRSPFTTVARLLLLAGFFVIFEYGVLSRSYGLGALLILAAVPLRATIWGWVCLALAANTSAHDLLAAGAVGGVFFMERPNWRGPLVLGVGVATAIATVYPIAPDLYPTSGAPHGPISARALRSLRLLSEGAVPSFPSLPYRWYNPLPPWRGVLVGFALLPVGMWALRKRRWAMMGYALLWVALFCLSVTAYELSQRHVGVLVIYLIACLWIGVERGDPLSRAATAWLAIMAICGLAFVASQPLRPFTEHREIAGWIRENGLAGEAWGAWPGREGTTLSAQLGRPTVNLEKDCLNTFVRWDYPHEKVSDPLAHIRATGVRYVISEAPLPAGHLLAHFSVGGGWEWPTWLYRFDNQPKALPVCR